MGRGWQLRTFHWHKSPEPSGRFGRYFVASAEFQPNAPSVLKVEGFSFEMTKHTVEDHGDLRKYFAAIPNVVFQLGLNPYELALYAHFKQAAGDDGGACWKSRATIAKESGMSSGMVTKARQALEIPRPELGGRPLVSVREEPSKSGGRPTCRVVITDIWAVNMSKCSTSPHDVATSYHDGAALATSPHDQRRHHTSLATSPHVPKEKPKKKNQEEKLKEDQQHAVRADSRGTRLPDDFCLNSSMREWATLNASHVDLDVALAEFCDYWRSIPGQRGKKLDWPATWRNRMRELEGRAMRNGNSNGTSQPREYQTASERRNAATIRNREREAELRRLGDGPIESILRGQSGASGR